MPIFEYRCMACGHDFEQLVRKSDPAPCPACGSENLDKRLALPAARSEQTKQRAARDIRARNETTRRDHAEAEAARVRAHDDE